MVFEVKKKIVPKTVPIIYIDKSHARLNKFDQKHDILNSV